MKKAIVSMKLVDTDHPRGSWQSREYTEKYDQSLFSLIDGRGEWDVILSSSEWEEIQEKLYRLESLEK